MNKAGYFGWPILAFVTLALAVAPDLITLPEPVGAIILDHASLQSSNGAADKVALPHALYPWDGGTPSVVRYAAVFDLPAQHDAPLYVFVPSSNRRMSLAFNGQTVSGFETVSLWTGPFIGRPELVRLPGAVSGHNRLLITVEIGSFAMPAYLSKIYIGSETALASAYRFRDFFDNQLKIMGVAAQVLLGIGLITAYLFRPKDTLYVLLAVFLASNFVVLPDLFLGWNPTLYRFAPFVTALTPAIGFLLVSLTLALLDIKPPKFLFVLAIAVPCALLPFSFLNTILSKVIVAAIAASLVTACCIAATLVNAWGAFRQGKFDARLMLAPIFLMAWYAVRDLYVSATLPAHGTNILFPYARPLFLALLTAVLMRRMSASLNQLDRSNEVLALRLSEREAELAVLNQKERIEAGYRIREQERHRLTQDLHDGISGHLASIVALSERSGEQAIEKAARDALSDLRLVIYSLDLGDRELPLALANLRDRLIPQLQRLGVHLDWSMAALPEVSGVTPGNALMVMRILQEAITNAMKHGPSRRIKIRGSTADDGNAAIIIENDGRPFVEKTAGYGLTNMRARAKQLHGVLTVENIEDGVKVALLFPTALPPLEDEDANVA